MKTQFVTALYNLEVSENLGRGDKLSDSMFLTNDPSAISKLIDPALVPIIGAMEYDAIRNAKAVVYGVDEMDGDITPADHLKTKLFTVSAFLNALWLAEDNAVNQEVGFLFYQRGLKSTVDSNSLALHFSKANGEEHSLTFSRQVLRQVRKFFRETVYLEEKPFEKDVTKLAGKIPRVSRALYFIQQARAASDLAIKIAIFCSALESLFATNQAELSHQLAERTACFLEAELDARLKIYRAIKSAYSVRSKIVHGDVLKMSIVERLPTISEQCDDLLRRCLVQIFSGPEVRQAFESTSQNLDEYLISLIFSRSDG